jgi:hypothetical protein
METLVLEEKKVSEPHTAAPSKPTFLCIGLAKTGTTTLIRYLAAHPQIFMTKKYEVNFFNNDSEYNRGCIYYENNFITDKLIVGEKTPSYCLPYAIDRIHRYSPNIKLVVLLREPISRAFSHFNMWLDHQEKTLDDVSDSTIMNIFKKEEQVQLLKLRTNGPLFVVKGKYDEIIIYIYTKFPKENVYIGIAEEIRMNKQKGYNDIFRFLGAELMNIDENIGDYGVRQYARPIPEILKKRLYTIYKPHNERLYKILGRKIDIWEEYYKTCK